jgi:CHAD domain-containing protein
MSKASALGLAKFHNAEIDYFGHKMFAHDLIRGSLGKHWHATSGIRIMNCLDRYRSRLLTAVNRDLRTIVVTPDEHSIHRFRVGVKRLTALYRFLGIVKPEIRARRLLKPARSLSASISKVRDGHITLGLISGLNDVDKDSLAILQRVLQAKIRQEYRDFQVLAGDIKIPLRLPTIASMGLAESRILRHKQDVLRQLINGISNDNHQSADVDWHRARILLKRYHHTWDALLRCPGQRLDASEIGQIEIGQIEIRQIEMLERLLGDWHDRVVAVDILHSFSELDNQATPVIIELDRQEGLLLGSARIYLQEFIRCKTSAQQV